MDVVLPGGNNPNVPERITNVQSLIPFKPTNPNGMEGGARIRVIKMYEVAKLKEPFLATKEGGQLVSEGVRQTTRVFGNSSSQPTQLPTPNKEASLSLEQRLSLGKKAFRLGGIKTDSQPLPGRDSMVTKAPSSFSRSGRPIASVMGSSVKSARLSTGTQGLAPPRPGRAFS